MREISVCNVACRSRPIRAAFLVDPSNTSAERLDCIFAYSMGFWGGRYYGVFPVVGEAVPRAWWRALLLLDPDIVLALCPVSEACVGQIERSILPGQYFGLTDSDQRLLAGNDRFFGHFPEGVRVHSVPRHMWSNRSPLSDLVFYLFSRQQATDLNGRLILRNFGVLDDDISTKAAFRELPVEKVDLSHGTAPELFSNLSRLGHASVLPIDLSQYSAARPYTLLGGTEPSGFHLTVGDSAYDAMYHWNRALVVERGKGRASLWLPSSASDDHALVEAVRQWIGRFYWESGQKCGYVVSYSVSSDRLSTLARMLSVRGELRFQPRPMNQDEFPFPDGHRAQDPRWGMSAPLLGQPNHNAVVDVRQVPTFSGHALIEPKVPPIAASAPEHERWMVDLQIQQTPEQEEAVSPRPDWTLAKRRGLAELFVSGKCARIVSGGLVSVDVNGAHPSLRVSSPSDRSIFKTLVLGPGVPPPDGVPRRQRKYKEMWTSDAGALLRGMLRLLGGLDSSHHVLLDDLFWGPILVQMAQGRHRRERWRTMRWLEQEYGRRASEAKKTGAHLNYWGTAANFKACAKYQFDDLVERGVLKQGVEIRCQNCGSYFWYQLDGLAPTVDCIGCGNAMRMPTDAQWSFFLNDLVANAIASKGVLEVVRALGFLRWKSQGMFLAMPCQNLTELRDAPPVTDLDILALAGGRFIIGEVKSSPTSFHASEVEKLAALAREIRPDEVVFAARGAAWPADIEHHITETRQSLQEAGVETLQLRLPEADWS